MSPTFSIREAQYGLAAPAVRATSAQDPGGCKRRAEPCTERGSMLAFCAFRAYIKGQLDIAVVLTFRCQTAADAFLDLRQILQEAAAFQTAV